MLDFSRFSHLTFDCYGTLIDWESGILCALRPILEAHLNEIPSDEEILGLYAVIESAIEAGPYRKYRAVLEQVVHDLCARLGFAPSNAEAASLPSSVSKWPPFPDTVQALRRLASRYKLVIVSNVNDDLIAATLPKLSVAFANVITAQQARSYKPSHKNFRLALECMGVPTEQVLHVAQSLYHDVAPAKQLGLATVWVNRRKDKPGSGATPAAPEHSADLEVPDLKSLADLANQSAAD